MNQSLIIESKYLGLTPYQEALALQEKLRAQLTTDHVSGSPVRHQLLGLEHPSVITLGKRAQPEKEVVNAEGTEIVAVDRGGLATLHNPGQLVIYPVFHLQSLGVGVRQWVQVLLESTADTFNAMGVRANAKFDPAGVFTEAGKIAFVGVQIRRGVSIHGLSINISNDLAEFKKIQSCGLSEAPLDSLARHGVLMGAKDFFEKWSVVFLENLRQIKAPLHAGLMGESHRLGSASSRVVRSHNGHQ